MTPPYTYCDPETVEPSSGASKSQHKPCDVTLYSKEVEEDKELKKHLFVNLVESRCGTKRPRLKIFAS